MSSQTAYARGRPSRLEPLKQIGRRLGLNKLYNAAWRHPARELHNLVRDGGIHQRRMTEAGHVAMRKAAHTLPMLPLPPNNLGSYVHILTGEKYWHQSAYCVASLQLTSGERITPIFYSDGTLSPLIQSLLANVIPWAEFRTTAEIDERLDAILPVSRFPILRRRRESYVHLRKLTDIHAFGGNWKLVLDSDLLFFRRPAALLDWFRAPHTLSMLDIKDNYGYPLDYLASLSGAPLPTRFNVGLYAIDSAEIDWDRVETWCARQLSDYGASYLQEQGLTAMIVAGQPVTELPEKDYVLMPSLREGRAPRAVMHHYVDYSKRSYFQHGWRRIDARIRATTPSPQQAGY